MKFKVLVELTFEFFLHFKVRRLSQTWNQLREKNEYKFNLYGILKNKFETLTTGGFVEIEKNVSSE